MFDWLTKLKERKAKNVAYMFSAELPVDNVLEGAAEAGLESVVIVGWTKDKKMYLGSSYAKRKDLLWDLSVAMDEVKHGG